MRNYFSRKDLIYKVYEEKSISKAAQKLHISQPSLSVMIQKIEEEVGVPLFDRTSKPISLTEAGREYIKQQKRSCTRKKLLRTTCRPVRNCRQAL